MKHFLLAFFAVFLTAFSAFAASGEWQGDDEVMVRLISEVDGTGDKEEITLGIEMRLARGWHTYWRSAGDTGMPPEIDWSPSMNDGGNLAGASFLYPAPRRFDVLGSEVIGYDGTVVFPVNAKIKNKGQALSVNANLDFLVCNDLCVPKKFSLRLVVPQGDAEPGMEAPTIKRALKAIPSTPDKSGMFIASIKNEGDALLIETKGEDKFNSPDIFLESPDGATFGKPETKISPDGYRVFFKVKMPEAASEKTVPDTVTVIDGNRAMEQKLGAHGNGDNIGHRPLWLIFLLSLVGGFVLNLMPCVLPVLSIKILSVASHGGGKAKDVRKSFLSTSAGIVFSFVVLAVMLILLKEAGKTVGWGVQFQQPTFLTFLIFLVAFFASNLWGLFEINLPAFLGDGASRIYHPKFAGDFTTGAFATLLATPCSAPFLGTAVGFAIAAGSAEIILVFASLGLGMAAPYLAVAVWPKMATSLPRPGAWMLKLRFALGCLLALTAVWLLWVLSSEVSEAIVVLVAVCAAATVFAFYLMKYKKARKDLWAAVAVFILAALFSSHFGYEPKDSKLSEEKWAAFDEKEIAAALAEGKTVFVNITADWCITCKFNKKFALSDDKVAERLFDDEKLVPMQGDWTTSDPAISSFLAKHGRYGVPFNAVFSPKRPNGYLLPELLMPNTVLEALDKTGGPMN